MYLATFTERLTIQCIFLLLPMFRANNGSAFIHPLRMLTSFLSLRRTYRRLLVSLFNRRTIKPSRNLCFIVVLPIFTDWSRHARISRHEELTHLRVRVKAYVMKRFFHFFFFFFLSLERWKAISRVKFMLAPCTGEEFYIDREKAPRVFGFHCRLFAIGKRRIWLIMECLISLT